MKTQESHTRLVTFVVVIGDEWDYDEIRRQIGNGDAELYNDEPAGFSASVA